MSRIDRRGKLAGQPFAYREGSDGAVILSWQGQPVVTLRGRAAARFLHRVRDADEAAAQLVMAKVTGNFKHGNERSVNRTAKL